MLYEKVKRLIDGDDKIKPSTTDQLIQVSSSVGHLVSIHKRCKYDVIQAHFQWLKLIDMIYCVGRKWLSGQCC